MRLTDEQRMLRDIGARLRPARAGAQCRRVGPHGAIPGGGGGRARAARLYGHAGARGIWRGRRRPCRLCAGAWRRSPPATARLDDPQRAELGRLHAGPAIRVGGAERALSQADGGGRDARVLLPDRAAGRLRRRRDQDARAAPRQPLGARRHQAVHHLRARTPRSRSSSRSPTPTPGKTRASAPLSCRPTARATGSRGSRTSSASAPPTPRSWSSRTWS